MANFRVQEHRQKLEELYNDVSEVTGENVKVSSPDKANIYNALGLPLKKRPRGRKVNFIFDISSDVQEVHQPSLSEDDSIDSDPNFDGSNDTIDEETGEVSSPSLRY